MSKPPGRCSEDQVKCSWSTSSFSDYPSNYGRVPDFQQFSGTGIFSMDNPEYILNEQQQKQQQQQLHPYRNNYHTLGIPVVRDKTSSPCSPSSVQVMPEAAAACASRGSNPFSSLSASPAGLNGVINGQCQSGFISQLPRLQPAAGDEESDEQDYYNDLDRLKRELQPLHPTRASTSMSGSAKTTKTSTSSASSATSPNPAKHETTV